MTTGTETTINAGEKYRKAQALIVEHLDLNSQDVDASKDSTFGKENWKYIYKPLKQTRTKSSTF